MKRKLFKMQNTICLVWILLLIAGPAVTSAASMATCTAPCCRPQTEVQLTNTPAGQVPQTCACCAGTRNAACKIKKGNMHPADTCIAAGWSRKENRKAGPGPFHGMIFSCTRLHRNRATLNDDIQHPHRSIPLFLATSAFLI